jgi:hypothetical protein
VSAARAAIVAKLATVADIGRVNNYERYSADFEGLKAHYVAQIDGAEQLRGWYVRRTGRKQQSPALGRYVITESWLIKGFMALADEAESELVFDDLCEVVIETFRTDETLGDAVASTVMDDGTAGLQMDSGPVMFAGVLCHSASLTLSTRRYL